MALIITLLLLIVGAQAYVIWAMNRKYNKLMGYTEAYVRFISVLYLKFKDAHEQMKAADVRGSFQADDEVGTTFDILKDCINDLYTFVTKYINAAEEEQKKQ
jgi:hypothetical protein